MVNIPDENGDDILIQSDVIEIKAHDIFSIFMWL